MGLDEMRNQLRVVADFRARAVVCADATSPIDGAGRNDASASKGSMGAGSASAATAVSPLDALTPNSFILEFS